MSKPYVIAVNPDITAPSSDVTRRYTQRGVLGRGGMGEVRLCRDDVIGRHVALKVALPTQASAAGPKADEAARRQFFREARIQGQLQHPAIVPVYDLVIPPDGDAYFTMKCLRGRTLAAILGQLTATDEAASEAYPQRRLLQALATICLALDFAHQSGVLHCDLKPSNLMLGHYGEVYVLDWGVARILAQPSVASGEQTAGGPTEPAPDAIFAGTLGYMSPEQARSEGESLNPASDVYALGAILFEILTLIPLHEGGGGPVTLYSTVMGKASARPSLRAPTREVAPELEAICVRATALKKQDRYTSARELHEALQRYLDGDRDMQRRRELANQHALAARAAAAAARSQKTEEEHRRLALHEAGRALALDPQNAAALETLMQVLTEPPRHLPTAVVQELNQRSRARNRHRAKVSAAGGSAMLLLVMMGIWWMGVRDATVVALTAMGLLTGVATVWLRGHMERPPRFLFYVEVGCRMAAIVAVGRLFGPLILMPGLLALASFYYGQGDEVHWSRFPVWAMSAALLISVVLDVSGILPQSYFFTAGALRVQSSAAQLPRVPSLLLLTAAALLMTVAPYLAMRRVKRTARDAERREVLRTWHLQQLLPNKPNDGSLLKRSKNN